MTEDAVADFFRSVGGKPVFHGGEPVWSFGWKPPEARSADEKKADEKYSEKIKPLTIGKAPAAPPEGHHELVRTVAGDNELVNLMAVWRHPLAKEALGFTFEGIWQAIGSCVGAAWGAAAMTTILTEVILQKDPEGISVPFWPLTWGKGRERGGMHDRGDGSFGSAQAEAAIKDGTVDAKSDGLPTFRERAPGWLWWGSDAELDWSQGRKMPTEWTSKAKLHLYKSAARCRDGNDVWDAIGNYNPVCCASMWGMRNPEGDSSVKGDPPVLMLRRTGSWAHQMTLLARMRHPSLGRIFFLHNQWGPDTYGRADPLTGVKGGGWITEDDVNWIARDEIFAYSTFAGFPARFLDPRAIA